MSTTNLKPTFVNCETGQPGADRPMDFIDLKSPYAVPRETSNARIQRVLDHSQYIMGPEVKGLEEKLAAFTGAKHSVTVANMDEINAIATRRGNLVVIEDAAQSFGATHKGRKGCNLSIFGCTNFFPSKPLHLQQAFAHHDSAKCARPGNPQAMPYNQPFNG